MNQGSQTIAVAIVTHNNDDALEQALDSVRWADEIVVVDMGSTDNTVALARKATKKVFYHPSHDPAVLRNYTLTQSKSDWVLHLEAYETVSEILRQEIDGKLLKAQNLDGFHIKHTVMFEEKTFHGLQSGSLGSLRLVRRNRGLTTNKGMTVTSIGQTQSLLNTISATPYKNIECLFHEANVQSTDGAFQDLETYGTIINPLTQSLSYTVFKPLMAFIKHYVFGGGFMHGRTGYLLAKANTINAFLRAVKKQTLREQHAQNT